MAKVILNGELIDSNQANIPVFNKAMFFNFAVYDSMKVVKGKSFFPEFHVERLIDSAKIIKLEHPFTKEEILSWIEKLIKANEIKDSLFRFLLLGAASPDEQPQLFIFSVGLTFYPSRDYNQGVKVVTYHGERKVPQAKSKELLLSFLAFREATNAQARDALLVDSEECIREGTRTNFFAVKAGKLYTALLTDVLEGVTLKIVKKLAKENEIEIVEEKVKLSELDKYDEFFITSTSMNVMPVVQIDNFVCKNGVGPVTKRLITLFKEYYDKEVFEL
jgi:branched-chain amino acid aminotransferase